jgi:hypothetical protein
MKLVLIAALCAVAGLAGAQDKMCTSVERVFAALPEKSRAQAMRPFDDRDRIDWHYGAALDAGGDAKIIERFTAAADHPVALEFPEGEYRKGLLVLRS